MKLCIMTKHLNYRLICQKNLVPDILGFIQMQLRKSELGCHILLRDKRLSPPTLQNTLYFFQSCEVRHEKSQIEVLRDSLQNCGPLYDVTLRCVCLGVYQE
ncbi:hypothetical protein ILYODFUR_000367 [Ilyodon furcidens]|uniref:Uncharacterized protein n=1 Tax=Ilyodon furcidens TaxID=33524 RepID=A0ABV0UCL0_9TELE